MVASMLEQAGIRCLTRNEYLGGGAGELPLNECWPEVWVLEEAEAAAALRLIEGALGAASNVREAWNCAGCGERLEGQFAQCWNCGSERPRETPE